MNTLPSTTGANSQDKGSEIPTLKPLRDDTPESDKANDNAGPHAWNLTRQMRMLADCDNQPAWRPRADLAAAFVDGKQFTPAQEMALIAEGLTDVRPTNLVGRIIRSLCGQEAKSRTDVKVESDDDETSDVCDALNASMKEAQRETYADMAVSEAYFGQVGPGIGWVEVAENPDPLAYPDRVSAVHRSEIWWDFKSTDVVLREGCRWMVRKRWADLDELEASMPQHRQLLRNVSNGWLGFAFDDTMDENDSRRAFDSVAMSSESTWTQYRRRSDWFDSTRKRVKLYEVWYKCPAIGVILHLSPSRRLLYDENNPTHVQAVLSGKIKVTKSLTTQIRMSLFAGPHRLKDIGTTRRNFPYVPFFAYRDDEDMSPYGLVEGMISPQMEYNARRIRINWMLRARQIIMDNDALDKSANTLENIADSIMRPDLTVILDANRANKDANAFRVGNNLPMQKEQIDVMQDAKQLIQDVPGVYGSQLGQAQTGVTSGIANSLLIEQGAVAMGDLNDNYRNSRRMVFENLLDQKIKQHLTSQLQVKIGRGSSARVVVLNDIDENGNIINNVADAAVRVGLGEVPSTPSFRMQQQQQIATIINALAGSSPQAVAVLAPSFIEATDLPDRMERADDLRRVSGLPTAGDKQQAAKMEQKAAEEQAKAAAMAEAGAKLAMEKEAAEINETKSKTELNNAKTFAIGHERGLESAMAARPDPAQAPDPKAEKERMINEAMQEALAGANAPKQQPEMMEA